MAANFIRLHLEQIDYTNKESMLLALSQLTSEQIDYTIMKSLLFGHI